jgi:hypothetical protein
MRVLPTTGGSAVGLSATGAWAEPLPVMALPYHDEDPVAVSNDVAKH